MPLTKTGKKIKRKMQKHYGKKKGEQVLYASIMKKKKRTSKWHKKRKKQ